MKKSHPVIESKTGLPVACLIASAYGGSSVHSSKNALVIGKSTIAYFASLTIPGVTFSTFTLSPAMTASKPGTLSAPIIWYLVS